MESDAEKIENLEEAVFKALDHQKRRDILRYTGEVGNATFTEIKNHVDFPDSPSLSYHLKSLEPFLEQRDGKYTLSSVGKSAYSLLLKTTMYNKQALFMKRKTGAIIGNIVLWLSAIAAGLVMGVDSFMTTIILPSLAFSSLMMIDKLFE